MKRRMAATLGLVTTGVLIGVSGCSGGGGGQSSDKPIVYIQTSMGRITVELDADRAPLTVANFLRYVDGGQYPETVFHRVVRGKVIQGGGYTRNFVARPTFPPIPSEAQNGLRNVRGAVGMARVSDPNSATNQFYINVIPNPQWDGQYTVFGKVIDGMEVVDKIAAVETGTIGSFQDCPLTPILIESILRKEVAAMAPPEDRPQ
jgi:peptidyl-prolyl cis-trans isomerase A (cyclophilin A)